MADTIKYVKDRSYIFHFLIISSIKDMDKKSELIERFSLSLKN